MKLIPLTKGQFAKVDDADYDELMKYNWFAQWNDHTKSFYAHRNQNLSAPGEKWKNSVVRMHRQLLGLGRGDPRKGDHENGDTLDYRRDNLRIANDINNAINRKKTSANTSGIKGVYFRKDKKSNPWGAFVKVAGTMIHLGFRPTKEEARDLRLKGEQQYYGEFATTR